MIMYQKNFLQKIQATDIDNTIIYLAGLITNACLATVWIFKITTFGTTVTAWRSRASFN